MLNILLAEDNTPVREGIKVLLEQEKNIKVVADAANGQEALTMVQQTKVDLVVTDLNMPVMDGYELMRELRKINPEIRIVVLSMNNSSAHISKALEAGASGYLLKETSYDEFIFALRFVSMGNKYISAELSVGMFEKYHHRNYQQT